MSLYDIAVGGLAAQSASLNKYAENIISDTTAASCDCGDSGGSAALPVDQLTIGGQTTSLEGNVVGLLAAKQGYSADAKLISVQRDLDKQLLNIIS